MKSILRMIVMAGLLVGLGGGCSPFWGLASLVSFGAGYFAATRNPMVTTTTEYYIDGVRVEDPAALGLE